MKPASIIFLIVAAVLALGGLVTMRIAEGIAKKDGVELIDETVADSDSYIFTYGYEADNIGKISVNVKDAKVNIIGGSSKPYIELVNFAEGMYEFSSSNRIITISNNSDFSSISNIASLAFNFKGLRSLVNYLNINGRDKTVNIYLSENYPIKVVECKVKSGEVKVEKCSSQTDYNLDIASGVLNADNVSTTSAMNIKLETGNVMLENCVVGNFVAKVGTGDININTSDIKMMTTELNNGNFKYGYTYSINLINLDLSSGIGNISIDGVNKGGYYEVGNLPVYAKYKITLGKGDIIINSNMTAEQSTDKMTAEQSK